jgi:hypothetical protein
MSNALYIAKLGTIAGSGIERWPGSYIFMGILLLTTNLRPLIIMKFWYFLYMLIWILASFSMGKILFENTSYGRLLPLTPLFVTAFAWHSFHFGKQFFSHILWAVALLALLASLRDSLSGRSLILIALLYIALIISHPLTSLLLLTLMLLLFLSLLVLPRIRRRMTATSLAMNERIKNVLMIMLLFWTFYYIWTGYVFGSFVNVFNFIKDMLLGGKEAPTQLLTYAPLPSYTSEYAKAIYLRMFSSLFVFFTGFVAGLIVLLRSRRLEHVFASLAVLTPLIFFASPFSRMTLAMLNRGVEHALVPYAAMIVATLQFLPKRRLRRLTLLLLIMVATLLMVLIPVTKYSMSVSTHVPSTSLNIAMFLSSNYLSKPDDRFYEPNIPLTMYYLLNLDAETIKLLDLSKPRIGVNLYEIYIIHPSDVEGLREAASRNKLIILTSRFYAYDLIWKNEITYVNFTNTLQEILNKDLTFIKAYTNSEYSIVYVRRS